MNIIFSRKYMRILLPIIISVMIITVIFFLSTILWIGISDYKITDIRIVLQLILQNMSGYSTLLAAIIATVFFQSYAASITDEKDIELKIQNIGHYTLAFQREGDEYKEEFIGEKIVLEICDDSDFNIESLEETKHYTHLFIKFLTSKSCATNLKNLMAFSDDYFVKNKKKIVTQYFSYCEKIKYSSPLYCSTKPTSEIENKTNADINRYFHLFVKFDDEKTKPIKDLWVSAITDEGVLLFIKIKLQIKKYYNTKPHCHYRLIQQTIYFKHNRKIIALFR